MTERDSMSAGDPRLHFHANPAGCGSGFSLLLALACLVAGAGQVCAETGFTPQGAASMLESNDAIAFVGGEDIVAAQQHGYIETLLAAETASKNLRFRNLGWEGDTVFEQRRELNFPSWEQTLAKVGATVVTAQFGQAESLRGPDAIPQFRQAATTLLGRLAGTNRHLIVLAPTPFEKPPGEQPDLTTNNVTLQVYSDELKRLCQSNQWTFIDPWVSDRAPSRPVTRDGLHLNAEGHWRLAAHLASVLQSKKDRRDMPPIRATGRFSSDAAEELRQAILAKNQLWFDYWRPQNWAFLAGDRTEQPSSRDHRNPKIRWFPSELEQFLPLIEAKESEVRMLAKKLQ